jgi:hypothetical protein
MHKIPSSNPAYVSGIEAAEAAEITYGALLHWVRTGRVQRYERTRSDAAIKRTGPTEIRQYWFDLDEVLAATRHSAEAALRRAHPDKRFVDGQGLADFLGCGYSKSMLIISRSGVHRYFYYGTSNTYMVDLYELTERLAGSRPVEEYILRKKLGLL